MNRYELVVIIDASISQEEKEKIVKGAGDAIVKCEGNVINSQVWLDKHKFTFRMKKRTEGTYYLINFESVKSGLSKLRNALRLNENILRSLIVKVG